jgi:hypothetical protein
LSTARSGMVWRYSRLPTRTGKCLVRPTASISGCSALAAFLDQRHHVAAVNGDHAGHGALV